MGDFSGFLEAFGVSHSLAVALGFLAAALLGRMISEKHRPALLYVAGVLILGACLLQGLNAIAKRGIATNVDAEMKRDKNENDADSIATLALNESGLPGTGTVGGIGGFWLKHINGPSYFFAPYPTLTQRQPETTWELHSKVSDHP